ncbi:hypothetical protein J6590_091109 [Homalodisca vitripennis]|nr:hypothetical protein J6590_091109 [Homalodisca vitripennis]
MQISTVVHLHWCQNSVTSPHVCYICTSIQEAYIYCCAPTQVSEQRYKSSCVPHLYKYTRDKYLLLYTYTGVRTALQVLLFVTSVQVYKRHISTAVHLHWCQNSVTSPPVCHICTSIQETNIYCCAPTLVSEQRYKSSCVPHLYKYTRDKYLLLYTYTGVRTALQVLMFATSVQVYKRKISTVVHLHWCQNSVTSPPVCHICTSIQETNIYCCAPTLVSEQRYKSSCLLHLYKYTSDKYLLLYTYTGVRTALQVLMFVTSVQVYKMQISTVVHLHWCQNSVTSPHVCYICTSIQETNIYCCTPTLVSEQRYKSSCLLHLYKYTRDKYLLLYTYTGVRTALQVLLFATSVQVYKRKISTVVLLHWCQNSVTSPHVCYMCTSIQDANIYCCAPTLVSEQLYKSSCLLHLYKYTRDKYLLLYTYTGVRTALQVLLCATSVQVYKMQISTVVHLHWCQNSVTSPLVCYICTSIQDENIYCCAPTLVSEQRYKSSCLLHLYKYTRCKYLLLCTYTGVRTALQVLMFATSVQVYKRKISTVVLLHWSQNSVTSPHVCYMCTSIQYANIYCCAPTLVSEQLYKSSCLLHLYKYTRDKYLLLYTYTGVRTALQVLMFATSVQVYKRQISTVVHLHWCQNSVTSPLVCYICTSIQEAYIYCCTPTLVSEQRYKSSCLLHLYKYTRGIYLLLYTYTGVRTALQVLLFATSVQVYKRKISTVVLLHWCQNSVTSPHVCYICTSTLSIVT